jgi:uncharacterized ion transporter superfamily protein YfcC
MASFRVPNALTLLIACTVIAAVLTHILPAGQYERRLDPVTGREVVVPGTYRHVPSQPVGPFGTVVAIPKGLVAGASVVFFVFLVGGAFGVVDRTGALREAIDWLARRLGDRGLLAIPIICLVFAAGGVFENLEEEVIPLVPAVLLLAQRMGFDAETAAAMSIGSALVGAAFSPVNPFQVVIAQQVAQVPPLSATGFRIIPLLLALAIWIAGTTRYAARIQRPTRPTPAGAGRPTGGTRPGLVLLLVLVSFAVFVFGVVHLGWSFDEEAALFFVMGVGAGLIGGLGIDGTADAFVEGFRSMAFAALLIGFARSISYVLEQGRVIDTLVDGLSSPLTHVPVTTAAIGMMLVQGIIHVPVPSVSGTAVLTLPILAPLSDLIGLSRQVAVLAYQYGAGLCELVTPTNGSLMAILAACGIRFERWLRVIGPIALATAALGAITLMVAVAVKLR